MFPWFLVTKVQHLSSSRPTLSIFATQTSLECGVMFKCDCRGTTYGAYTSLPTGHRQGCVCQAGAQPQSLHTPSAETLDLWVQRVRMQTTLWRIR